MNKNTLNLLNEALARPQGIVIRMDDRRRATTLRNRLNKARARYRENLEKTNPLAQCPYDTLMLVIEEGPGHALLKIVPEEFHLGALQVYDFETGEPVKPRFTEEELLDEEPETSVPLEEPENEFDLDKYLANIQNRKAPDDDEDEED